MKTAPIHLVIPKAFYTLTDGEKDTYTKLYGSAPLPETITFSLICNCCANKSKIVKAGKIHMDVGEIYGEFEPTEHSPLMRELPYYIGVHVTRIENYPRIMGYGQIRVSNEEGDIVNYTQDLVVVVSLDGGFNNIMIYYFEGMAGDAERFVAYLNSHV